MSGTISRQHQFGDNCREPVYRSPSVDEALVGLSRSVILNVQFCWAYRNKKPLQGGPLSRAGFRTQRPIKTTESMQRDMPSARRRHFCILLLPGKSMASGGTRTAGSAFGFQQRLRTNRLTICWSLFIFDHRSKKPISLIYLAGKTSSSNVRVWK